MCVVQVHAWFDFGGAAAHAAPDSLAATGVAEGGRSEGSGTGAGGSQENEAAAAEAAAAAPHEGMSDADILAAIVETVAVSVLRVPPEVKARDRSVTFRFVRCSSVPCLPR